MKVVLDTTAIIFLNDFRKFDEILTVPEVIEEVKDRISSMKLSGIKIKIIEPSKESIEKIKSAARETGDLEKLSKTDIRVLALANENNCEMISDDRNVQNIAERIGIKYVSVFNEKITKLINWKKFCRNCKKDFQQGDVCPICGSKLSRIPRNSKDVARKTL